MGLQKLSLQARALNGQHESIEVVAKVCPSCVTDYREKFKTETKGRQGESGKYSSHSMMGFHLNHHVRGGGTQTSGRIIVLQN